MDLNFSSFASITIFISKSFIILLCYYFSHPYFSFSILLASYWNVYNNIFTYPISTSFVLPTILKDSFARFPQLGFQSNTYWNVVLVIFLSIALSLVFEVYSSKYQAFVISIIFLSFFIISFQLKLHSNVLLQT